LLRKALIRAGKTSHTAGTLSDIKPEDFQPVYHAAILGGDKEFNIFS
jgi:hypothetical protein